MTSPLADPADALAAVTHPDPGPFYDRLRGGPALAFDARLGLWVAARPGVVSELLAHPACRVRPPAEPVPRALQDTPAGAVFGQLVRMTDGERHRGPSLVLRHALAGVAASEVQAAAASRTTATGLLRGEPAALSRWLFELPLGVLAALLGVPAEQEPAVVEAAGRFAAGVSPLAGAAERAGASAAAEQLLPCLAGLLLDRPGGPLAALRREAAAHGWHDAHAQAANLLGLLMQTCDACAGLLGNGVVALAREPAWLDRLRGEAGAAQDLVEHVLRWDPPVQNTRRFLAADAVIAGQALAAGDAVLLVLAAALRDPAAPATLDFGQGRHACPGQAIARTLAAAGLHVLARHAPALRLQPLRWTYRPSANARVPLFHGAPQP